MRRPRRKPRCPNWCEWHRCHLDRGHKDWCCAEGCSWPQENSDDTGMTRGLKMSPWRPVPGLKPREISEVRCRACGQETPASRKQRERRWALQRRRDFGI